MSRLFQAIRNSGPSLAVCAFMSKVIAAYMALMYKVSLVYDCFYLLLKNHPRGSQDQFKKKRYVNMIMHVVEMKKRTMSACIDGYKYKIIDTYITNAQHSITQASTVKI